MSLSESSASTQPDPVPSATEPRAKRRCTGPCGLSKPIESFYRRRRRHRRLGDPEARDSWCKDCQRGRDRLNYRKRAERSIAGRKPNRVCRRCYGLAHRLERPCVCGLVPSELSR
jgi:hypothetical protein